MKTRFTLSILFIGFVTAGMFSGDLARAEETPKRIEIVAKRFAYAPGEITLKKGQPVVLVIKSLDTAHGLRFRELNINAKIDKGGSAELRFTPNNTGDYIGHCSVFCGSGHGEMMLVLHVVD